MLCAAVLSAADHATKKTHFVAKNHCAHVCRVSLASGRLGGGRRAGRTRGGGALGSLVDSADSWDRAGGAAPEISQSFLPEESPAGGESLWHDTLNTQESRGTRNSEEIIRLEEYKYNKKKS